MSKLKRRKVKLMGCVVLIAALLIGENWLYKNRTVHFEDDKMRQVICLELGKDKNSQNVTYKELEKIEELRIGPVGEFETIIDVAMCRNLKELWVNVEITDKQASYELYEKTEEGAMYYPQISKKKVAKVQEELIKILKGMKSIERLEFTNVNETCDITNLSFLKYASNLKRIGIAYGNVSDYSKLQNCTKLESVDLWKSNIETADALLSLRNVNRFILTGTPLAENKKEINRIKKAFPEADIIVD